MFAYTLYKLAKPKGYTLEERFRSLPRELQTEENKQKLFAYIVAVETERFETNWQVFEKVCLTLNDRQIDPEILEKPSIPEIAWAVVEVQLEKPIIGFLPEVRKYVQQVALHDHWVYLCDALHYFRQELADQPLFEEVAEAYREWQQKNWEGFSFTEKDEKDPVKVQLYRLKLCEDYVNLRLKELMVEVQRWLPNIHLSKTT